MGLREIEPGMAIHCRTEEEARALIGWAYECGYKWMNGSPKEYTAFDAYGEYTCYSFYENGKITYADKAYFEEYKKKEVIEFSALFLSELTGKEPRIETVDVCRIIEILPDGGRRCVHEADIGLDAPFGSERLEAEEMLKGYCMGHEGDFIAVHEVVSRVKKDRIKA